MAHPSRDDNFFRHFLNTRAVPVIIHPVFLAVLLGLTTYLILPYRPEPYLFELEQHETRVYDEGGEFRFFAKLTASSETNNIIASNFLLNKTGIVIFRSNGNPIDQWNFDGEFTRMESSCYVGDYDRNSLREIYCFTFMNNRLLINVVEPYGNITHLVKNRFIDTIWRVYDPSPGYVEDVAFYDLNHDGFTDLVFSIRAGFSLQPRKVYAFDIQNDSLWSSPFAGSVISQILLDDMDSDGRVEITGSCHAAYNYDEVSVIYPDSLCWLFFYDENLQFISKPEPIGGRFDYINPLVIKSGPQVKRFIVHNSNKAEATGTHLYELDGMKIGPEITPAGIPGGFLGDAVVSDSDPNYWMLKGHISGSTHLILFFSPDLELIKTVGQVSHSEHVTIRNHEDALPDVAYCIHCRTKPNQIVLFDNHGQVLAREMLSGTYTSIQASWAAPDGPVRRLQFTGGAELLIYRITRNPWQYAQYLVLIGLIGSFYYLLSLLRRAQLQQVERRERMRREILELQLKSVRNQLDPHFTFNALNSLAALSSTGDQMGVNRFISHFSRLLRNYLDNSDKILVRLTDELEFVDNYIELQRIRFDNQVCLDLDVGEEVDLQRMIPKMLIQTHVENAVKHGRRGTGAPGHKGTGAQGQEGKGECGVRITVAVKETDEGMYIMVQDNGVGRGHSRAVSYESTGKGLKALERILESVRKLYGMDFRQEITDLADEQGNAMGTRVEVRGG